MLVILGLAERLEKLAPLARRKLFLTHPRRLSSAVLATATRKPAQSNIIPSSSPCYPRLSLGPNTAILGLPPFTPDSTSHSDLLRGESRHHCGAGSITSRASSSFVPRLGDRMSPPASGINTRPAPPMRAYTPPPPDPDSSSTFLTDQIAKQQRSNFHSSSLQYVTMVSQSVNKTALHPKGVEYVHLPDSENAIQHTILTYHVKAPGRAHRD